LSIVYFETHSKLCKRIRVSMAYWNYIVGIKHRTIRGLEDRVKGALINPVEVRRSPRNSSVYLYYGRYRDKFICVVAKHLNGEGYIVTAYLTKRFVRGEAVWRG